MNQVEDAANGHYIVHTLTSKGADASEDGTGRGIPIIAFDWQAGGSGDTSFRGKSRSYIVRKGEYAGSVQAAKHDAIQQGAMVRRLTVTECERLFALPDGYTAFGADGKPISDSARYRMLGNAAIVSVILWIARRIVREEEQCSKAT